MKFSLRRKNNNNNNNGNRNIALSLMHGKPTQRLNSGKQGFFQLLTLTALSVARLITTWLSTFSSKWIFHKYLAATVDVNGVWQANWKHIMFKLKFLITHCFHSIDRSGRNYHDCFRFVGWIHCEIVPCFQTLPILIRCKYLLGLGAGMQNKYFL